tara:strand:+ start:1381 stop:1698 length:318 start_codon:yes stop_codon:yes gene_type:complete
MIDTDKYEGHTEGKWKLHYDDSAVDGDYLDYGAQLDPVGALHPMLIANAQLIADAPLLLAEVKRLRGIIDYIRDTGRMERTYGPLLSIMEKVLTTEEYLEWRDEE